MAVPLNLGELSSFKLTKVRKVYYTLMEHQC